MEQSTCMLDGDQDAEPIKKTRISVAMQSDDLDIKEVKEIREYLVELQAVLIRYEEDYEILNCEKEAINSQLIATQKEVASLREVLSFKRPGRQSSAKGDVSPEKLEAYAEDFETSCIMEEQSMIARQPDMELIDDDGAISPEKIYVLKKSPAPASSIDMELLAEKLEQLKNSNENLESNLIEVTEKLQLLQEEVNAKTIALEESQKALDAAVLANKALELVNEQKDEVINSLRQVNDDIQVVREESVSLRGELETTRLSLTEAQPKLSEMSEEKELFAGKMTETIEEIESARSELKLALEQINQKHPVNTNNLALEMELAKALDRIKDLEAEIDSKIAIKSSFGTKEPNSSNEDLDIALNTIKQLEAELEFKTSDAQAVQLVLEQAHSRMEELEIQLTRLPNEELSIALNKIQELEAEIELKTSEVQAVQSTLEQALDRVEELEAKFADFSNEKLTASLNTIKALEAEVESKTAEIQAIQTALEQACTRAEELESKAVSAVNGELIIASNRIRDLQEELDKKSTEMEAVIKAHEEASSRLAAIENQPTQEELGLVVLRFEALKHEMDVKETELASVKAELVEARSMIGKEKHQGEMSSLQAELERANAHIKTLQGELLIKSSEVDAFKLVIKEASSKVGEADCSEREKLEELVERLTCQLEELEQKVEEKDHLLNDARDAAYQSSIEHKELMEEEKKKYHKEVDQLLEQINELQGQLEATSADLFSVKQELTNSSTQAREMLLANKNAEIQLASAKRKLDELEEQIKESNAHLEVVCNPSSEIDAAQLSKLETELEEARKKIEELQFKNDFLQADLTSAEVRSGELEAQLEAKIAALAITHSTSAKLEEVRDQLDARVDQIRDLKHKLEEADIQIADLCSHKEEVQAELLQARERIQSLEEDLESEKDALLATQRTAKEVSELAEAKLAESETEKNKISLELKGAMQEIESLRQSIEAAASELQAARDQIGALEETNRANNVPLENLTALEQEWKEAVKRVSQLEDFMEQETRKYNDAYRNLEAAQSQIQESCTQIVTLQNNLEDMANTNAIQNEQMALLQNTLHAKNEEISNLYTSTAKISILENQVEILNAEMAQLSRIVEEKNQIIATLEENLSQVSQDEQSRIEQMQHMEKRLKERQAELEDTRLALVAMQTANEEMSADLNDKENLNVELRKSLESTTQRFEMVRTKLEAVQAEKSRFAHQIERLEVEIDSREQELQALRGGVESLHQERELCQHLHQRLSNVQADKEAAIQHCEKLREARDELLRQQDRLTQELHELASRLHASDSAKSNVEQTLARYESQKDVFLQDYQRLKEALASTEDRMKHEIQELKSQLHASNVAKETLERNAFQYETQKESLVQEYQRMKASLSSTEERLGREIEELVAQLQISNAAKATMEQNMAQFEGQKEAFLQDYQRLKKSLADTEEQLQIVQVQRDDYLTQLKTLNEQMTEARARINAFESTAKYQTQRHLEETIEALKRELVETRSNSEISKLNHETEEENRKKKIDRLEKELDALKQQYVKCKEQLRLSRYRESEEGTVNLPKMRSSATSTFVQTDPIADKGFGFRWQADQYSADNERLRKKVSEIGERMEFYKEKLIKYRTLYFQATGQDANQRPSSGNSNPIQPVERRSSTSSNHRENIAGDCPLLESDKPVKGKPLTPTSGSGAGGTLAEQQVREPAKGVQTRSATGSLPGMTGATRWAGTKKESLTKEEMEKINNCNPS